MFREPLKNSAYTEEFIGAPASGRFMHFNKEGVCVCVRERESVRRRVHLHAFCGND